MTERLNLDSLFDFKDLAQPKCRQAQEDSTSQSSENEALLRSFKELRQKLKLTQKDNVNLKEQLKIQHIRDKQNQQALQIALSNNIELKEQATRDSQTIEELRKKLAQMKGQIDRFNSVEQELCFTKEALLESRMTEKALIEENNKKSVMFLEEKMQLQDDIAKLKAKNKSDEEFIVGLERQLSKKQANSLKLENKMRKMSLSFEENSFTNKWSRENFETSHLTQTIAELQKKVQHLQNKLTAEKEKRMVLEDQLIELEENAGLTQVKACTFEEESGMLLRKQQKLAKKLDSYKQKLSMMSEQKIEVQEQLNQYKMLVQRIISKLQTNRSKQSELFLQQIISQLQKIDKNDSVPTNPSADLKHNNNENGGVRENALQERNIISVSFENDTKKYQSNPQASIHPSDQRFTFGLSKQNQPPQVAAVQVKIRRQREEMERRIREKRYQHGLQSSRPHQKHRFRSDYLNFFPEK